MYRVVFGINASNYHKGRVFGHINGEITVQVSEGNITNRQEATEAARVLLDTMRLKVTNVSIELHPEGAQRQYEVTVIAPAIPEAERAADLKGA